LSVTEIRPSHDVPDTIEYPGLPVESLNEALPHLRRPFTPEAIRFKVQNVWKNKQGCIIVAYIDARLVIERLNAVVAGGWTFEPQATQDGKHMIGNLTVLGVKRSDVGQSVKGFSKDLWSDALKRAAVPFGIGVSVYSLPEIIRTLDGEKNNRYPAIEKRGSGEKETLALTPAGHATLRAGYKAWLEQTGIRMFGQPLDHGDVESDAVVGESEVTDAPPVEAPEEPARDEEGKNLVERAREIKDEIAALPGGKQRLPGGQFAGWLAAARTNEDLKKLIVTLTAIRIELGGA